MATLVGTSCRSSCARRRGRKQALREAKQRLAERKARAADQEQDDGESRVGRGGSRSGAVRDPQLGPAQLVARRPRHELERQRERQQRQVVRDRDERLFEAARRLEENLQVETAANERMSAGDARAAPRIATRVAHPAERPTRMRRPCCRTAGSTPLTPTRG